MPEKNSTPEPPLHLPDFDYILPKDRIANEPARPRDSARLLVVDRRTERWTDARFTDLAEFLNPKDLVVVNDTRVIPARFLAKLERTGRDIEVLCVNPVDARTWNALLRPARRVRQGDRLEIAPGHELVVGSRDADGLHQLGLAEEQGPDIAALMEAFGHVPLPPYIDRPEDPHDKDDYQTIYAQKAGAVAAPTAGLHFSQGVFESLAGRGIETLQMTLHVGIGTFVPIRSEDPRGHRLQPERYTLSSATAAALNQARQEGRRIIAVGTTTTRALEHIFRTHGCFQSGPGQTDLYILPGYRFSVIEGLVTNFHLPRTTLLLLVSAFASRQLVLKVYQHAIDAEYRFYSYGDATLFL